MSLLLIEDQTKLASNIARYLETEGHAVVVCHNGQRGLELALTGTHSLIILDLNLPDMDGLEICRRLRSQHISTPILMLTARTGSSQAVKGFGAGADDYLGKPFDLAELAARVQALLRRDHPSEEALSAHGIHVDLASCQVAKDGTPLSLAPREYDLLVYLLRHKGAVQDRTTLIEQVWGDDPDLMFSQTVDVHIAYLRRKCGKELIATVPGKGYMISD